MTDPLILGEFAIRMAGTAFVVIAISWIAVRLGPAIGGVVVGLPIVLAPGLGFMLLDQPPAFVADAAAGALFSLSATQAFLLAFVILSGRTGPFVSVAGGALAWLVLALPLGVVPHPPLIGAALFAAVTLAARRIGRRWVAGQNAKAAGTKWGLLILRGLLAGLLVGRRCWAQDSQVRSWLSPSVSRSSRFRCIWIMAALSPVRPPLPA